MTKDEMTDFIEKYLSDKISSDLIEECDNFPNPPTEHEWISHIENLVKSGHLLEHPSRTHIVARKPTVKQVTNIDNAVKDSVVISHSRFDKSPVVTNIKNSPSQPTSQPDNQDEIKSTLSKVWDWFSKFWWIVVSAVVGALAKFGFDHNWFGIADKLK